MGNRCLNDVFMYCSEEPVADSGEEVTSGDLTVIANRCKLDPETCGKCVPMIAQINPIDLEKLAMRGGVKFTLKPATQETTSKEKKEKKAEPSPQVGML